MSRFVDTLLQTARESQQGVVVGEPSGPRRITWDEVHRQALGMAAALADELAAPGTAVAVLAAEPATIAAAVQATWLAGGSVTMLHQPTPRTDLAVWAEDTVRVLNMIGTRLVLLGPPFEQLAPVLEQHDIRYRMLSELAAVPQDREFTPVAAPEDGTALLQLTSGSTAEPKAVRITHRNLHSNITAMAEETGLDPGSDLMMSWLPLFHDMGMVGFLTVPMTLGIELVKITPVEFLTSPLVWPELISKYGATITAAPNFAYAMVGRRLADAEDGAYDLSSLRIALNGAEPVDEDAVGGFTDAGARFGMPAECVLAAYGMAETTLAVSFSPVFRGLVLDRIDPADLESSSRATPVDAGGPGPHVRSFPKLGPPLSGLEVDVVDAGGAHLDERGVGELLVRGDAVTPGYLTVDGPLATQDEDGWLTTGDLGYLADGEVVVCGRSKDVIIMGGRNIYPTDIERAAGTVDGVRPGNAAAIRLDAGSRRERFAVACESKLAGTSEEETRIVREVAARVKDAVDMRPQRVLVLPPGSLPKTPSGKLRRAAARDLVGD